MMNIDHLILLFCVLPSASVLLNLTSLKDDKYEIYYHLIILFLSISTCNHLDEDEGSLLPLIPILLASVDEILSRSCCHSLTVLIWNRWPIFQLSVRSAIPSSLILLYLYSASKILDIGRRQNSNGLYEQHKFIVFGISWLSFFLFHLRERRKVWKIFTFQSSLLSSIHDFQKPDERNWEHWTNDECRNWVAYNYRKRIANMFDDEFHYILYVFKKERIHGMTLYFLQKDDFVAMGISQGDAAFIYYDILELKSHNLSQIQRDKSDSTEIDLDKWLGKKIGQTADSLFEDESTREYGFKTDVVEIDDEVLKPSFGHFTNKNGNIPPQAEVIRSHNNIELTDGIDTFVIDSMPPNIREIASRRPDLVRELIRKHQRLKKDSPESSDRDLIEDSHLDESELYEQDDDWQTDGHPEMIGLLRRRRNNKKDIVNI